MPHQACKTRAAMCTLECVERLLVNLKVIGRVPAGGRLVTYCDRIEIESESVYQPLWRWWRGQSREKALDELKRTYLHAMRITATALAGPLPSPTGPLIMPIPLHVFQALRQELQRSLQGLLHLKNTYGHDVTMQSKLQLLHEEVVNHLRELEAAWPVHASSASQPLPAGTGPHGASSTTFNSPLSSPTTAPSSPSVLVMNAPPANLAATNGHSGFLGRAAAAAAALGMPMAATRAFPHHIDNDNDDVDAL